jgi:DNA polymerase III psi subunit
MKNLTEINYPNNSKIWIFSSSKPLNSNQTEIVSSRLNKFFKNWTSHGKKLKSDFMIPRPQRTNNPRQKNQN